jgi:hypothetical protein
MTEDTLKAEVGFNVKTRSNLKKKKSTPESNTTSEKRT